MSIKELKDMVKGMRKNSFRSLAFRMKCNNDTIDFDKVWKAYHFAVSKLN